MSKSSEQAVTVVLLTGLDKPLGYRVPAAMRENIAVGSLVRVPILRRTELGVVKSLANLSEVIVKF